MFAFWEVFFEWKGTICTHLEDPGMISTYLSTDEIYDSLSLWKNTFIYIYICTSGCSKDVVKTLSASSTVSIQASSALWCWVVEEKLLCKMPVAPTSCLPLAHPIPWASTTIRQNLGSFWMMTNDKPYYTWIKMMVRKPTYKKMVAKGPRTSRNLHIQLPIDQLCCFSSPPNFLPAKTKQKKNTAPFQDATKAQRHNFQAYKKYFAVVSLLLLVLKCCNNHLGCMKASKYWDKYQPELVSRIPSINSMSG